MFAESRPEVIEDMRQAADELRAELAGDLVTFVVNRNINVSNICTVGCAFCGFGVGKRSPDAYEHSRADFVRRVHDAVAFGATEICMQSGIHPDWGLEDYLELAAAREGDRAGDPPARVQPDGGRAHVRRLGAARRTRCSSSCVEAGLGSVPGTAAEVLHDGVRQRISPNKLPAARWVEIITAAHEVGLRSTVTVMFGHIETPAELAEHMRVVRDAAGAHGRLHRVRAVELHPVPDAARPHARDRGDLARGEPQAHGGVPARARADDPVAAGELGEDGARRRDRGAALGRQRPRRDADGGVDLAHGGRRPRRQARARSSSSPPPTAPAGPRPSGRRCTRSGATTTSPPRRETLQLGPLLRHTGADEATVWVQTDGPCTVEVRARGRRAGARADVHRRGPPLRARARHRAAAGGGDAVRGRCSTARSSGPSPTREFPPSVLRTHTPRGRGDGSCSAPAASPRRTSRRTRCARTSTRTAARSTRCAASRCSMRHEPPEEWPHALLLLGDQVYADEVAPARRGAARRRGRSRPTTTTSTLYMASWGEPVIRWLLSTVPSAMIFDDHDVHDDWNTSIEWVAGDAREGLVAAADRGRVRELPHLPAPREHVARASAPSSSSTSDLRTAPDPTPRCASTRARADEEVEGTRWSFCRDIGPARVVMVDSRAGRVLDPGNRSMVDPERVGVDHRARLAATSSTC